MKKQFFLFVLSLLVLLPQGSFATEASVSVVPSITQLKVSESMQVLFSFTLKNNHPQPIDIRSFSFKNTGSLALEPVLSDLEILDDQGNVISTRVRFFEDWNVNKKELLSSKVQFQLSPQVISTGDWEEYKIRGVVKGGVDDGTLQFKTDSVSVFVPGTNFVRDLSLDASDLDQSFTIVAEDDTPYNPVISSLETSELAPDLVVEEMYFAKEYGYQKDVIVVPVCNQGNGPTPVGSRIEGTIYTVENYLRDFTLRKTLESGKCFEQIFSAKRDLRINKAASHSVRVQLDLQNLIKEERENNNERQDLVVIKDKSVDTKTEFITDQPLSLRQRILARLGLKRTRPNAYNRTEVNENAKPRPFSFRRVYKNPETQKDKKESYVIHPNYGDEGRYLGTNRLLQEFSPLGNNIIRKELPETAEEIWEDTKWERDSASRNIRLNKGIVLTPEPTKAVDPNLVPTFRTPSAVNRYRTSYRGLRSGVRTETDFRGGRTNDDPIFSTKEGLAVFCEDSDGVNSYEKGEVRYKSRRMPKERTAEDVTRGNFVLEYFCDGNYMRRQLIRCEGEVGDGMCKE